MRELIKLLLLVLCKWRLVSSQLELEVVEVADRQINQMGLLLQVLVLDRVLA